MILYYIILKIAQFICNFCNIFATFWGLLKFPIAKIENTSWFFIIFFLTKNEIVNQTKADINNLKSEIQNDLNEKYISINKLKSNCW